MARAKGLIKIPEGKQVLQQGEKNQRPDPDLIRTSGQEKTMKPFPVKTSNCSMLPHIYIKF